jgi:flagellar hook assembly protein FlgD
MAMSGALQATLAPVTPNASVEYNQLKVSKQEKAADMGEVAPDLDFRTMLQNSNAEVGRDRAAKKTGDLSAAKTDEDFYRMLNERNNPQRAPKNQLGKDDFMKLFIAQMQNQDPLNPSDASQMAAQMAQFNSLEQMMNVNNTLGQLVKGQEASKAVQMINYVGKEVDIGTGMLKFDKGKLTKASFAIEQALPGGTLEVRDGSGTVISQEELGTLMPGEHNVKWSGKLKDGAEALPGIYNFQIVGKSQDGQEVSVPIKTKVKVTGLDLKDEGGAFYTELGKIQPKDVASIGIQGFDDAKAAVVKGASKNGTSDQTDKKEANSNGVKAAGPNADAMTSAQGIPQEILDAAQKQLGQMPKSEESSSNDEKALKPSGMQTENQKAKSTSEPSESSSSPNLNPIPIEYAGANTPIG